MGKIKQVYICSMGKEAKITCRKQVVPVNQPKTQRLPKPEDCGEKPLGNTIRRIERKSLENAGKGGRSDVKNKEAKNLQNWRVYKFQGQRQKGNRQSCV